MTASHARLRQGFGGQAVVLGGGMAGLMAARVLSDRFGRVTIVERGALANSLTPRAGTPQAHHVHAVLARGLALMEFWMPGLTAEMVAGGATLVGASDARVYVLGWRKPNDSPLRVLCVTRPFLEWTIARRVRALPTVAVVEHAEAEGVVWDNARATAVTVAKADGGHETLAADLIVDARGRRSNLTDWMKAAGLAPPPLLTSPLASVYCSYLLQPAPGAAQPQVHQVAEFAKKTGVLIFPVEGGRVLMSLGANTDMAIPRSHAEMLAFLQTLPVPDAYLAVKDMTPLTPPAFSRFTASVRRDFETMARPAHGVVAIGDAVASFNPVFGQGMTVAALEAEWLGQCLAQHGADTPTFAPAYYKGVKPIVDIAWGAPDLEAKRNNPEAQSAITRFLLWYTERIQKAAARSAHVSRVIAEVQNMMAPPTALFRPGVFARVMRG